LSALGDVVAALQQRSSHVPYRNSKVRCTLVQAAAWLYTMMLAAVQLRAECCGQCCWCDSQCAHAALHAARTVHGAGALAKLHCRCCCNAANAPVGGLPGWQQQDAAGGQLQPCRRECWRVQVLPGLCSTCPQGGAGGSAAQHRCTWQPRVTSSRRQQHTPHVRP
jgi:hypothetical protein